MINKARILLVQCNTLDKKGDMFTKESLLDKNGELLPCYQALVGEPVYDERTKDSRTLVGYINSVILDEEKKWVWGIIDLDNNIEFEFAAKDFSISTKNKNDTNI